jgi:hypothetical protein
MRYNEAVKESRSEPSRRTRQKAPLQGQDEKTTFRERGFFSFDLCACILCEWLMRDSAILALSAIGLGCANNGPCIFTRPQLCPQLLTSTIIFHQIFSVHALQP